MQAMSQVGPFVSTEFVRILHTTRKCTGICVWASVPESLQFPCLDRALEHVVNVQQKLAWIDNYDCDRLSDLFHNRQGAVNPVSEDNTEALLSD